jgi:predicted TPR repeat methyltransferase
MRDNRGAFDLIVSADTLVYFGRLEDAAAAAAVALRPGGRLAFTVEALVDAGPGDTYVLRNHGRYCHARPYVEATLVGAGFEVDIELAVLRLEAGEPVPGFVVLATKRAQAEGEPCRE